MIDNLFWSIFYIIFSILKKKFHLKLVLDFIKKIDFIVWKKLKSKSK